MYQISGQLTRPDALPQWQVIGYYADYSTLCIALNELLELPGDYAAFRLRKLSDDQEHDDVLTNAVLMTIGRG